MQELDTVGMRNAVELDGGIGARFARDGFVTGLRIHGPPDAARVRADFDRLEAREGPDRCAIGLVDRHFDQQFVWELATHPAILDAVEAVLGPEVLLLATHFFCKYPAAGSGDSRYVAWHQDVTYWGLEPPLAVTAWYAVDDADVENGCMRILPGTHAALRPHGKATVAGNLLSINQECPADGREVARAVDVCLRSGEASLHHGLAVHGSNPNVSNRRRCGLTVRFIPPTVAIVGENSLRRPWRPVWVRGGGQAACDVEPPPFPLRHGDVRRPSGPQAAGFAA